MENLKKHFLLAVSSDQSVQYGARFLGYFVKNKTNVLVDLLNIAHNPQKTMTDKQDHGPAQQTGLKRSYMEKGHQALNAASQKLQELGFPGNQLKTDLKMQSVSTVKDLIYYGRKGSYDALVLGRRGLTMLENLIQDSISSKIMDEEYDMPIWICREPVKEKKNVLLCADGSRPSLSIADHVGYVLNEEAEHKITILHVRSSAEEFSAEEIMKKTTEQLTRNGIQQSRIHQETISGNNISRIILDYSMEKNFAAIAMGREGCNRADNGWSCWFIGSVSATVMKNFNRCSLWIHK